VKAVYGLEWRTLSKVRATITIDANLWLKFRAECRKQGATQSDVVEHLIERWMD